LQPLEHRAEHEELLLMPLVDLARGGRLHAALRIGEREHQEQILEVGAPDPAARGLLLPSS
jgi:hypothetical protein